MNDVSHYATNASGIEVIELARYMSFDTGNALKYLARFRDKNSPQEDLLKAVDYLQDAVAILGEHINDQTFYQHSNKNLDFQKIRTFIENEQSVYIREALYLTFQLEIFGNSGLLSANTIIESLKEYANEIYAKEEAERIRAIREQELCEAAEKYMELDPLNVKYESAVPIGTPIDENGNIETPKTNDVAWENVDKLVAPSLNALFETEQDNTGWITSTTGDNRVENAEKAEKMKEAKKNSVSDVLLEKLNTQMLQTDYTNAKDITVDECNKIHKECINQTSTEEHKKQLTEQIEENKKDIEAAQRSAKRKKVKKEPKEVIQGTY